MRRPVAPAVIGLLLALGSRDAVAATLCSGFNTSISFGSYVSGSDVPVDSLALFEVTCTQDGGPANTAVMVGLGPSAQSGLTRRRQMSTAAGNDRLEYNLYRDPTRLSVWGDVGGVDTMTQAVRLGAGGSGVLAFTIFGRIPPRQEVRVGEYSDQILITVDF